MMESDSPAACAGGPNISAGAVDRLKKGGA